ncbi:hypothetical protein SEA_GHOBES_9 [Gordonia phage Ghobes]|uniref:Head-to-tail connector protein n=1 Tax=Gordonia phage Ghobes TaxID=1887647 RepID=A0A1B3B039_9CAUD|nr:head closure Hc1 [Gordonia phage Ghobes]AOE44362.1 hypothetical protein SEA_GHOBES_9 [Gordonia phage Ghobes]
MAADRVEVNLDFDELFQEANDTLQVEAALRQRAQEVATKARRIDERENGGRSNFRLESGYLPNGRRYHRVASDNVASEYGDSDNKRLSILRRASGGGTRGR